MENHLKDAQLKYLQAQINPHFLFNTLNAGAQLAMMEDANRTYEYIQKVAELFRYNIKKSNEIVTLREEIDLIDNYIYILNVRFSGEIQYIKQIEEAVKDKLDEITLPGMILQPIIENSVNYGIRNIDW
ncbi:MAG: histidine kinase, partial [Lachnospiraceae bacterium]|nr:histidine kinase [Lachnospiraceae bacterium]